MNYKSWNIGGTAIQTPGFHSFTILFFRRIAKAAGAEGIENAMMMNMPNPLFSYLGSATKSKTVFFNN
jgi:hypothetical protein